LRPAGTHRIHFQAESQRFRRTFLAGVAGLPITARVYTAQERTDRDSRRVILDRLVADLVEMGAERLVLELDDSVVRHDEAVLKAARVKLPDAMAWAWCRDRTWRSAVARLVTEETQV
jgi:hypothetical protein